MVASATRSTTDCSASGSSSSARRSTNCIANKITAQLLLLAADPDKDIYLYINSPGGSITAGMAIYDTMQFIKNDVVTIAMGMAASMVESLLSAGTPGKRFALPNAEILIHQPSAGLAGSASDIKIHAERLLHTKKRMAELTSFHTGQTVEQITRDSDRDRWFILIEAKEYGLIDDIVPTAAGMPGGGGTGPFRSSMLPPGRRVAPRRSPGAPSAPERRRRPSSAPSRPPQALTGSSGDTVNDFPGQRHLRPHAGRVHRSSCGVPLRHPALRRAHLAGRARSTTRTRSCSRSA